MINNIIYKIFEYAPSPSYAFDNADSDTNDHPSEDIHPKKKKFPIRKKRMSNLDNDESKKYQLRMRGSLE